MFCLVVFIIKLFINKSQFELSDLKLGIDLYLVYKYHVVQYYHECDY